MAGCELDGYRILRADTTVDFDDFTDDSADGGTPSVVLVEDTGNTDRSYYDHDVHYKFYVTYDGTRQYFGYDAMPSMGTFQRSGDMTYWYVVQARCGDKIAKRTPWDIGRVEIDQPDVLPAPVWLDVDTAGASDTSEAPGPVRSLRVVAAAGSLTVTWQAPADIGTDDYATSQYRVDWADNDGFSGASAGSHTLSPVTGDRNERFSYTIPDLDNDTTYYVRVTTIGASAASDPVSSSATPSNSPSQPRSLSASINTASEEITVTWQAPERNGGTAIASYQLQYTTAANFNTPSEKTVTGTVSATLTTAAGDFSPGADLRIRVLATNTGGGQGPPSDIMRVSTLVDPGPVRSLMLDAADASLVVKWQPPADPGGADYRTTSYRVEWADNAVFTNPNQAVVSATTNSATEMLRHTISEYGSPAVALVNGDTYYVRVTTVSSTNLVSAPVSASAAPNAPPSAPQSLAASINTATEIIIVTWQAPASNGGAAIASYRLQYTTAADFNTPSAITEQTVTAGTVSVTLTTAAGDFTPGANLNIRVLATNAAGAEGPPSGIVLVATHVDPDPVRSLAVAAGDASLVVTWRAPADLGGAGYAMTFYKVEWALDAAFTNPSQVLVAATGGTAAETFRQEISQYGMPAVDLVNGTTYHVRVTTTPPGDLRATAVATGTPSNNPPGAPTMLNVSIGHEDSSVTVSWTAPTTTGAAAPVRYDVQHTTAANFGSPADVTTVNAGAALTFKVTADLEYGSAHLFQVIAFNSGGAAGAPSNSVSATPTGLPGAVRDLAATPAAPREAALEVTWQAPADNGGIGYGANTYLVSATKSGETPVTATVTAGAGDTAATTFTHTFTGLVRDADYDIAVIADNTAATGGQGDAATITATARYQAPDAPRQVSVSITSASLQKIGAVTVRWRVPDYTGPGSTALTEYRVEYTAESDFTTDPAKVSAATIVPSRTSEFLQVSTDLSYGSLHLFRVVAVNEFGDSDPSDTKMFTPLRTPSNVRDLAVEPNDGGATVTWKASEQDHGQGWHNLAYRLTWGVGEYADSAGNTEVEGAAGDTAETTYSYPITGLTNGTIYNVTAQARPDFPGAFTSNAFETVFPWTPRPDAPDAPASVVAMVNDQNGQVALTWAVPTATGSAALSSYRVEYTSAANFSDPGQVTSVPGVALSASPSHTITDANDYGATYLARVIAINANGDESGPSAEAMFVPLNKPGAVVALLVQPGDAQLTVTWKGPADNGGFPYEANHYTVQWKLDTAAAYADADTAIVNAGSGDDADTEYRQVIMSLDNDVAYNVQVYADNKPDDDGEGEGPLAKGGATPVSGNPGPATSVIVSVDGATGAAKVTWDAPAHPGNGTLTMYRIEYTLAADFSDPNQITTVDVALSPSPTHTITDADQYGSDYRLRIIVLNSAGSTSTSAEVVFTAAGPPAEPTALMVTGRSGRIDIAWAAPTNTGGVSLITYEIQLSTDAGANWVDHIRDAGDELELTETVGGLTADSVLTTGDMYLARVRAVNMAGGVSDWVTSVTAATVLRSYDPPALRLFEGHGRMLVRFLPSADADADVTGYRVQWKSGTEEFHDGRGRTVNATSIQTAASQSRYDEDGNATPITYFDYSQTGLSNNTAYTFRVRALSSSNIEGQWSPELTATPKSSGIPTGNRVFTGGWSIENHDTYMLVAMALPSRGSNGGAPVSSYYMQPRVTANRFRPTLLILPDTTPTDVTDDDWRTVRIQVYPDPVSIGQYVTGVFTYTVFAENANGRTQFPGTKSFFGGTVPPAPENLRVVTGDDSLTLVWDTYAPYDEVNQLGYESVGAFCFQWRESAGSEPFGDRDVNNAGYFPPVVNPYAAEAERYLCYTTEGDGKQRRYSSDSSRWEGQYVNFMREHSFTSIPGLKPSTEYEVRFSTEFGSDDKPLLGEWSDLVTVTTAEDTTPPAMIATDPAVTTQNLEPPVAGVEPDSEVIEITFSEPLAVPWATADTPFNGGSNPTVDTDGLELDASLFSVTVDSGSPAAPLSATAVGFVVRLTLHGPVYTGQAVVVSYARGAVTTGVIADLAGNPAADFSAVAVTNNSMAAGNAPWAPTALTVAGLGRRIEVSWQAPGNNGGSELTVYVIELSSDGAIYESHSRAAGDELELSETVGGLTPGDKYAVRVRAVNTAGGQSAWVTSESDATVLDSYGPPALRLFEGHEKVLLRFLPSAGADSDVTGYLIQWKSGTDAYGASTPRAVPVGDILTADSQSRYLADGTVEPITYFDYSVTGLSNGTAYTFRVRAVSPSSVERQWSQDMTATPINGGVSTISRLPQNSGSFKPWTIENPGPYFLVRMGPPSGSDISAGPISGFYIVPNVQSNPQRLNLVYLPDDTPGDATDDGWRAVRIDTFPNPTIGDYYYNGDIFLNLFAVNANGRSQDEARERVSGGWQPPAPQSARVVADANSLTLVWDEYDPRDVDGYTYGSGGSRLAGYCFQWRETSGTPFLASDPNNPRYFPHEGNPYAAAPTNYYCSNSGGDANLNFDTDGSAWRYSAIGFLDAHPFFTIGGLTASAEYEIRVFVQTDTTGIPSAWSEVVTATTAADTTAPAMLSAVTTQNLEPPMTGEIPVNEVIEITFDEPLASPWADANTPFNGNDADIMVNSDGIVLDASLFTVTVNDVDVPVVSATAVGLVVRVTLDAVVGTGQDVVVGYDALGSGTDVIQDLAGNPPKDFSNIAVTNNSMAVVTAPGAVRMLLVADTANAGELTVTWQAPESDGGVGYAAVSFLLEWKTASGAYDLVNLTNVVATLTDDATTTYEHTITGLTSTDMYTVRVTTSNTVGPGPAAESAAASPRSAGPPGKEGSSENSAPEPPGAPQRLTAQVTAEGMALSWSAPDSEVTGYLILRRRPDQGERRLEVLVADTGSTATTYTDQTANVDGVRYVFRVKALNGTAISGWSNFVNITYHD